MTRLLLLWIVALLPILSYAQCEENMRAAVENNLVRSQEAFQTDFVYFACITLEMYNTLGNERYLQTDYEGGFLVGRFYNNLLLTDADLATQIDRIDRLLIELSVYRDNAIAGTRPFARTFASNWYKNLYLLKQFLEDINGYVSENDRIETALIKRVGLASRMFFNGF